MIERFRNWLARPPTLEAAAGPGSGRHRLTPAVGTSGGAPGFRYGPSRQWGTGRAALEPVDFPWPPEELPVNRELAMTVPTISRARDLLCSAIGSLPLVLYLRADPQTWTLADPYPWQDRPDPYRTRNWMLAWTADDLVFYEHAYWHVTARYATGYPAAFERLPAAEVTIGEDADTVRWRSTTFPVADVVEFLSPLCGLLEVGWRALSIALRLDSAADRFAGTEVPAGWLKQTGGEPLSPAELQELAVGFTAARRANTTAALNEWVDYHESNADPAKLQLTEGRQHQALELARVANVPPFLVGAPAGTGMTYQNAEQARRDLIDFGALPYINCIEQTLSGPNVLPRGQQVLLDTQAWLRSPFTGTGTGAEPAPADTGPVTPPTPIREVPAA